jgi:hypothetical protein
MAAKIRIYLDAVYKKGAIQRGARIAHISGMRLCARPVFSLFLTVVVCTIPSWAQAADERVRLSIEPLSHQGHSYELVTLDIDPLRWDQSQPTFDEVLKRHQADQLLRTANTFLRERHIQDGKSEQGPPLDRLILQSFDRYPDPAGRMQWSDAGRPMHKVDDYFEHRSLILILRETGTDGPAGVVGTVKFVKTTPERLMAPVFAAYSGFIPAPFGLAAPANADYVPIEYENLARASAGDSPVPLLLTEAARNPFFDFLHDKNVHSTTSLNAEDEFVAYHKHFGFEVEPGFFDGLPAKRMSEDTRKFLAAVQDYAGGQMRVHPDKVFDLPCGDRLLANQARF